MMHDYWTPERVAGGLLAASLAMMLLALVIMIVSRAIGSFGPMIGGDIAAAAPYADTFRLLILLFVIAWIVHLLGFGLFGRLLALEGESQIASVAFIIILIATVTAVVNFSFRMTVELWAAGQLAAGAELPALYEPLRAWTSSVFRLGYVSHLVAMIGVGWAILRTGILGPWLGWATIGWSALMLVGAFVGAGAPAVPLLMPAVIGIALLSG